MILLQFIDSRTTNRILKVAQDQQEEEYEESGEHESRTTKARKTHDIAGEYSDREDDDGDYSSLDENEEATEQYYESYYDELKINKDDEKGLELFMTKDHLKRQTLSDYIQNKLREKEVELKELIQEEGQAGGVRTTDLDEKVVELYKGLFLIFALLW